MVESDNGNCGGCGMTCQSGQSCQGGVCACQQGLSACAGGCVDLMSDADNCGTCGNACPSGQVCSQGGCALACEQALTECSQSCVDLDASSAHCGSCDNQCQGGQACSGGSCGCAGGGAFCGGECVDTSTSNSHCGECDNACTGGQTCNAGSCVCPQGQLFCNEQCRNVSQDPAHCGSCDESCDSGQSCVNASCQCNGGQTLCNDGCVDTMTDPANCGSCGNACASGGCSNGTCNPVQGTGELVGWASVSGDGVNTTTGGEGGEVVSVNGSSALSSAASGSTPRVVQVTGNINIGELDVGSNKTIVGMSSSVTINGGIKINGEQNVIIRNLNINGSSSDAGGGDGIHIQDSHHIWVDHVEIWDSPDGNLDINDYSNWITVSWSIFRYTHTGAHRFSNLIGSGDGETQDQNRLKVTWHHNWWSENVHERMPRVRFGQVHVFNNYYTSSGNNYCIRAGHMANIRVENNYFENVDSPHELDADNATMSASGNEYPGSTGARETRGTAFSPPYPYTPESASAARSAVMASAGPQ